MIGAKRWRRGLAGLCLLSLILAADIPAAIAAESPLQINAILSLTGFASFLGKISQETMQRVEQVVNAQGGIHGRPVHFVFFDDQSSPQTAVQLVNQILPTHPTVLIGPSLSSTTSAIAPLLQRGPVTYSLSPGVHPPAGSYVFTASVSTLDLADALVRFFRMKGWTRFALMTSTDASGQDAERGFATVLRRPENKNMVLVASPHFNVSDVSVTAQIEQVGNARPQAFVAWSTGAPVATILRAVAQAGMDIPIATTDANMTYPQMSQYAGFLPKELYFPAPEWPVGGDPVIQLPAEVAAQQKVFYDTFQHDLLPQASVELGWEGPLMIIAALRKLGPQAKASQLHDYLLHLKGYAGIDGIYDFQGSPQRGLDATNAIVTRWNSAKKDWDVVSKPTGVPLQP